MKEAKLLYENRSFEDKKFIYRVCKDILQTRYLNGPKSDLFAGIFVEGRNRQACLEDLAALSSFKAFSQCNYPIYCFLHNENFFDGYNASFLNDYRIKIFKIPEINSLESYTEFCIEKLYFMLPNWIENVITLQPDGMLLRAGWEDYVLNSNVDWLSSHWRHMAGIDIIYNNHILNVCPKTPIGNGGFSFRRKSKLKQISKDFWKCNNLIHKQIESGRDDERIPMEDLFFCYWGFGYNIMKTPTLKQCDQFSQDPLTPKIYESEDKPFGFHFFKNLSEPDWPECNHQ